MMYDFLAGKTTGLLAPRLGCQPGDPTYDRLWYGAHVFYMNALKCLLLLALALLLGVARYVLVFALAYGALRTFSFGVHLSKPLHCTLLGLAYYLGSAWLSLNTAFPIWSKAALIVLCGIIFAVYAPGETEKRPIPKRKRAGYKAKSCFVLLAEGSLCISLHYAAPVCSSLFCMALVCQSINLLPITYKIIRRLERNEKN